MREVTLKFKDIHPASFFGVNQKNIKTIKRYFPTVEFITRGNNIKLLGEDHETKEVANILKKMIDQLSENKTLSNSKVEEIISCKNTDYNILPEQIILHTQKGKIVKAVTPSQIKMVEEIEKKDLILATGNAGSGKTYTAVALAVKLLKNKKIKRIILTRPAVEAGESLGFLPGDLKEKLDPYLQPLYDALREMIPSEKLRELMEEEIIQIAPLAFMRGRTLKKAFVILDEGQNASKNQIKMFLTRMGKGTKFVITGDLSQIDLAKKELSGLSEAIALLKNLEGVSFIEFGHADNMRHPLVSKIIELYNK